MSRTAAIDKVPSDSMKGFTLAGVKLPMFFISTVIVFAAMYMGVLPGGMIGAFPLMIIVGAILNEIGNRTPIIKDYLGGGAIVVIFGSAALTTYGVFPESASTIISNFMRGEGFLTFYIAALITGSILGMDRNLLIKASIRYLPAILGGVALAMGLTFIVGSIIGYGGTEAMLYIAVPIMGGGMGAGAVPLSQIFGEALQIDMGQMLSKMVPALALGNALAIVTAGLLNKLGKKKTELTGNGALLLPSPDSNKQNMAQKKEAEEVSKVQQRKPEYITMGIGLLLSTAFFALGKILGSFIPIHSYALMIISVAIVKALGIMPREYEVGAFQWFRFIMVVLTPTLLVGIGVAYTDLNAVINALSFSYIILVVVTLIGAVFGAGIVGRLLGFYPIESAITAGLCMANMGGTGDVAVLSASKRMELMPFAQISSRIGGAFMLILATALLGIL